MVPGKKNVGAITHAATRNCQRRTNDDDLDDIVKRLVVSRLRRRREEDGGAVMFRRSVEVDLIVEFSIISDCHGCWLDRSEFFYATQEAC